MRWPWAPRRSRASASTRRTSATRRRDGRQLLEGGAGRGRDDARQRRLAASGRPVEDRRPHAVLLDREPQRRALAEDVPLARRSRRASRGRSRCASGATSEARSLRGVGEEVAHAGSMLRRVAVEDFSQPVLPGEGASDYERYLRTDELLALQKRPEERAHRDELLFQTVHQSSELWLKLAAEELEAAVEHLAARELAAALRLLRRASPLPAVRDRAAGHARADVAVGVPGDQARARPRQRLRLARLARAAPLGPRARAGAARDSPRAGPRPRLGVRRRAARARGALPARGGARSSSTSGRRRGASATTRSSRASSATRSSGRRARPSRCSAGSWTDPSTPSCGRSGTS